MAESLFDEVEDRIVTAFDIDDKPHLLPLKSFRLRVSVYGILQEGDKVFVQRHPNIEQYSLPGGGIGLGEGLEVALKREYLEETGIKIKPVRIFAAIEDFITYGMENAFGILVIYLVEKADNAVRPIASTEDSAEAKFVPIEELLNGKIRRVFRSIIRELTLSKSNKKNEK